MVAHRWVYRHRSTGVIALVVENEPCAHFYWRMCEKKWLENLFFPSVTWWHREGYDGTSYGWAVGFYEPMNLLTEAEFAAIAPELAEVYNDGGYSDGDWWYDEKTKRPYPPQELRDWGGLVFDPWRVLEEAAGTTLGGPGNDYFHPGVFGKRPDGSIACLLPWTSVPAGWETIPL